MPDQPPQPSAAAFHVREERPDDIGTIHQLTKAAFANAAHTDHTEHVVVDALRRANALPVSLVLELEQEQQQGQKHDSSVVGHVALSPVTISDGSTGWFGLGPLSVLPEYQRRGYGSALMHAALQALAVRKAAGCVLLGEPSYYYRFGFRSVPQLTLAGVPPEYFQALRLHGDWPDGEVCYHDAFHATE